MTRKPNNGIDYSQYKTNRNGYQKWSSYSEIEQQTFQNRGTIEKSIHMPIWSWKNVSKMDPTYTISWKIKQNGFNLPNFQVKIGQ